MTTTKNTRPAVGDIVARIEDLPSIPETLIRILRVIEDPVSNAQALADVIECDAPLTTKILRLANSPFYPRQGDPLTDMKSCVRVLGYRTVRQVAICVSIASSLVAACSQIRARIDYRQLWRHSVVTAATARELARLAGPLPGDDLFTAALLHDLGKFLLIIEAPELYDAVVEERQEIGGTLVSLERERLGFDHTALGAEYMKHWRFPSAVIDVCKGHHDVYGREADPTPEVAVVALADYLANTLDPPASDLGFEPDGFPLHRLHEVIGVTVEEVQAHKAAFAQAREQADSLLDIS